MPSFRGTKGKSQRIKCVTNLKNVGLAARIYASDKGGQMPGTFLLSNSVPVSNATALEYFAQLSIPTSILFCPDDQRRKPADSFTNISLKNISYFASLTANETLPVAFLSGDRNLQNHGQPVPLLSPPTLCSAGRSKFTMARATSPSSDGSVQQFSSSRLSESVHDQSVATNLLLMP